MREIDDEVERSVVVLPSGDTVRVLIRGRGPTLLMINGIGGHVGMWEPLAEELSRTRRLVLFDAPGAGMSGHLPRPMRMSGLAKVVVQMLDELDVTRTDVLGYSWGGALAQQLAHDHPDRVRQLVLVATIPGMGGRPPKLRVVASMLSPDRYRSNDRSRALSAVIYGGDYRPVEGQPTRNLRPSWHAHPPTLRGYSQQLYAITGWSSLHWLHQITQRTLIISGEDDPLVPRSNARILARLIPQSELHMIPDAGHLWLLDHPVRSTALIEEFLGD